MLRAQLSVCVSDGPARGPARPELERLVLSERQIDLIRQSWQRLDGERPALAARFYGRFFAIAPYARSLFDSDLAAQARKLAETLDFLVSHLDDAPARAEAVRALARRHAGYGVVPADYAPVSEAMIWTLDRVFEPPLDTATRDAWLLAVHELTRQMRREAEASPAPAAARDGDLP
jgi:nitric oxide dioxygenase